MNYIQDINKYNIHGLQYFEKKIKVFYFELISRNVMDMIEAFFKIIEGLTSNVVFFLLNKVK